MNNLQHRCRQGVKCLLFLLALLLPLLLRPAVVVAAMEYNERIFFVDDFDACTNERVTISGVQHIIGRFTTDGAGHQHFGFTGNTYGTGTGQSSGATYQLINIVNRASVEIPTGGVITFTQGNQSRLLRQGEGAPNDDTMIHFLSHITVNANGDVAATVDIKQVTCR